MDQSKSCDTRGNLLGGTIVMLVRMKMTLNKQCLEWEDDTFEAKEKNREPEEEQVVF